MNILYRNLILLVICCLPCAVFGQAMTVLGGDAWAQGCFDNAEYAATNMPILSRSLVEPCDSALDFGTLTLADRAATYANRGIILAATSYVDEAMSDYAKAMAIRPESAEIFVNRGNAFFLGGDYAMAMEDYERSLELGILQVHYVRYNMGMTYERLGNDEAAERELRSALEIDPEWELVQRRLDRLLLRKEERQQGRRPPPEN